MENPSCQLGFDSAAQKANAAAQMSESSVDYITKVGRPFPGAGGDAPQRHWGHRRAALAFQPATASGALPLPRKPCRVLRRGSVAPLQVVAVAEKGRGNSLVHEKEKGEQSVYIKVGKPHKVDFTTGTKQKCKKQNRKKRMATLIKEMPQLRKST